MRKKNPGIKDDVILKKWNEKKTTLPPVKPKES